MAEAAAAGETLLKTPLHAEHRVWQRSEFSLSGVPDAKNPFDPDEIAVTALSPTGVASTPALIAP